MKRVMVLLLLATVAAMTPLTLMAESNTESIKQGALLYDNWPKLTGASLAFHRHRRYLRRPDQDG